MSFDNLMGYILSIPVCMQNFITIFRSVQEIGPFSLFQHLELGKTLTDEKWHFTISWAKSCQYQYLCRSLSKYSLSSRDKAISTFSELALSKASTDDKCPKTQPISNVIWQSHGVRLVNINVYAKFHHNISLSSRDSAIIAFSQFGAR